MLKTVSSTVFRMWDLWDLGGGGGGQVVGTGYFPWDGQLLLSWIRILLECQPRPGPPTQQPAEAQKVSGKHDGGVGVMGIPGGKLFIVSNCFNRFCAYLGKMLLKM